MRGQPIARPGHGLKSILKQMDKLYQCATSDPLFIKHLDRLMHPLGAPSVDFIELRYSPDDIAPESMKDWKKSFIYVCGWLRKNARVVL
jgi:hypothetical protein